MGSKSKLRPDYIGEINLPSDKLIDALTKNLKEEHGLTTKRLSDAMNVFFSEDHLHSFRKTVIETIPAQIEWSVEKLSPTQCRLAVFFPFPPWLRNRFCSGFLALGCLFSVILLAMLSYDSTELKENMHSFPLFLLIFALVAVLTLMVFTILLGLYLRLLRMYLLFWRSFLQNAFGSTRCGFMPILHRIVPIRCRIWLDLKVLVFATCAFLGAPIIYIRKDLLKVLGKPEFILFFFVYGVVLTLFFSITLRKRNKRSLVEKASASSPNFCCVCLVGFFLFGVPTAMYVYANSAIHCANVAETGDATTLDYQIVAPHSSDITSPSVVRADLCLLSVGMICSQFLIYGVAIGHFIVSSRSFAYYLCTRSMQYNKSLREIFHAEITSREGIQRTSLHLPVIIKISFILLFVALSAICWAGVFLNLSLVNALVAPNFRSIPISHGETIAEGAMLMASAILGHAEGRSVHVLRLFLVAPALLPFILFVFLSLRALIFLHVKSRSLTPIKNSIAAKTKDIAGIVGVSEVSCFLDRRSNRISPYAVVKGWRARNMIVFSRRSLAFLAGHPEHADAIIAHEVAHLKGDCLTLWKLRLISRLGLTGIGYVSTLHDSIAMEDRADDDARKYLRKTGRDENLLTEAAFMLEAQEYAENEFSGSTRPIPAFSPLHNPSRPESSHIRESFFKRFVMALRTAHDAYFLVDLYDYIHREARYRFTV
jgi:hypothetical protein